MKGIFVIKWDIDIFFYNLDEKINTINSFKKILTIK
jgi:hypothetical protein